jgi:tetratricopeptide (TPR) repeat protein
VTGSRLDLAEELIDVGRLDDAARIIDAELAADPESAGALCAQARLRSRTGDYSGMRAAASAAASQRPNWEYPHRLISVAARLQDEPAVAVTAAEAAVAAAPLDPATHQVHAQALIAAGRYVEAYGAAVRARELAPTDPESFHVLAEVYQAAGDLPAARRMYLEELRLAPDSVDPHGGLAYLRWIGGRDAAAARAYRDVLAGAPTDDYYRRALHSAITFVQYRWVAVAVAGVVALMLMNRAGVTRPVRLGVAAAIVVGVLAGAWLAHRGLGAVLREQTRWSLRTLGPIAPLPAAGKIALGLALYATVPGPPYGFLATVVKVLVVIAALLPAFLLIAELGAWVARWHRRRVLRRAIRAGSGRGEGKAAVKRPGLPAGTAGVSGRGAGGGPS